MEELAIIVTILRNLKKEIRNCSCKVFVATCLKQMNIFFTEPTSHIIPGHWAPRNT